jgi:hypothetical protein
LDIRDSRPLAMREWVERRTRGSIAIDFASLNGRGREMQHSRHAGYGRIEEQRAHSALALTALFPLSKNWIRANTGLAG